MYEGVSKSYRTGCLERELQMVHLSATILWVSLVNLPPLPFMLFSTSVYFCCIYLLSTQSGNFWIHSRKSKVRTRCAKGPSVMHPVLRGADRPFVWKPVQYMKQQNDWRQRNRLWTRLANSDNWSNQYRKFPVFSLLWSHVIVHTVIPICA
jgi:hypothetical protein